MQFSDFAHANDHLGVRLREKTTARSGSCSGRRLKGISHSITINNHPVNSKGMTRTKGLIQGWKRSEMLIVNTIRKSDLYVSEYRPVDSSSRWSSVVIAASVAPEVAKAVLAEVAGVVVETKSG